MWMQILEDSSVLIDKNIPLKEKITFLRPLQVKLEAEPGSVILIELKNNYNSQKPSSVYELATLLGMPTVIPVSIEGSGLAPFINALFIANLQLKSDASAVVIVVKQPSDNICSASESYEVADDKNRIITLCLTNELWDHNSSVLDIFTLPISLENCKPVILDNSGSFKNPINQIFSSTGWFLKKISREHLVTTREIEINGDILEDTNQKSCFYLLSNLLKILNSKGVIIPLELSNNETKDID